VTDVVLVSAEVPPIRERSAIVNRQNHNRVKVLLIAASLLAVSVLVGCGDNDEDSYLLEVTETRTWTSSGITEIYATTVNGSVTAEASQDTVVTCIVTRRCRGKDRAEAEQYIGNVVVEDTIDGGRLVITADMPDSSDRDYSADFEIFTPESVYLALVTVNGNLAAISTADGARLTATNGTLSSSSLEGGVSGQIVNGNATCDLASLTVGEAATLATTNGNVTISVPSDVSSVFDVRTVNGTVEVTGFPSVTYSLNTPNHKIGVIGTPPGEAAINITIVNGNGTITAR
jgi:hypothetical protein